MTCARCGAPMLPLADLAAIALEAAGAYRSMKMAVPDALSRGVLALAAALPCHAGLCQGGEGAPATAASSCAECGRVRAEFLGDEGDGFATGLGGLCPACLRPREEGHGTECPVARIFDLRRCRLPPWWMDPTIDDPRPADPGNDPSAAG